MFENDDYARKWFSEALGNLKKCCRIYPTTKGEWAKGEILDVAALGPEGGMPYPAALKLEYVTPALPRITPILSLS